ncbi:YjzC family protein [Gorillibacterium sp. sgz5001074]|uniref:YjzC family protein n=1 Tax=Gorillibacterium sp. sgz5001074 TaxID=3446695 RepID=UPI003F66B413
MGEVTRFHAGQKAPNDGEYREVGENAAVHSAIEHPAHVYLNKGEKFPENSNEDRAWVLQRRKQR